jgi:hypothetical protein
MKVTPNILHPDDLYECLVTMIDGLDAATSLKIQARLILLLANQIGDVSVIKQAIRAARSELDRDRHFERKGQ